MRREPRAWTRLDTGALKGKTAAGLKRLGSSIPTTSLASLRLAPEDYKDKTTSAQWVAFVKGLRCEKSLTTLELVSKKFGEGAQTLKALERLVANVESFEINGVKGRNGEAFAKLLRAMPKLRRLALSTSDMNRFFLLTRLAQLAALQRGPGAKSLLESIRETSNWFYGPRLHVRWLLIELCGASVEIKMLRIRSAWSNLNGCGEREITQTS